ncbi:MAG: tetratricopeptide repeat protein, partial [Deltaproteobacteria bacterium]
RSLLEVIADCARNLGDPALELRALEALRDVEGSGRPVRLAELLEGANRTAEAAEAWKRAFQSDPADPAAALGYARILEGRKRWGELADLLGQRAAVLASQGAVAVESRAELLCRQAGLLAEPLGDRSAAEVAYRQALELVPTFAPALSALAAICEARGATPEACELLDREISLGGGAERIASLATRLGDLRRDLGDAEAALSAYRRGLSAAEEAGDLGLAGLLSASAGQLLLGLGRSAEALEAGARALELGPESDGAATAHLVCARAAHRLGEIDRAWSHWKGLLALRPADAEALAALEEIGRGQGPERLVELMGQRALAEPDRERRAALFVEMAELRRRALADPEGAETALRFAFDAWPDGTRPYAELVALLEGAGRLDELADLMRARSRRAASEPVRAETLRELGDLLRARLRDPRAASEAFSRALELEPRDAVAAEGLAESLWAIGESARAETYYVRALGMGGGHLGAFFLHFRLGQIALLAERRDDALEQLRRCVALNPAFVPGREELATAAIDANEHDIAREALLGIVESLGASPEFKEQTARAWLRIGEVEKRALRFPAAVEAFERSVELDPEDPRPLRELAPLYEQRGQWTEAVQTLERLAERSQGGAAGNALVEAGLLLFDKLADMAGAAERFERALELVPREPRALRRLAEICSALGRGDRLLAIAEVAIALEPPNGPGWLDEYLPNVADVYEARGDFERAHWAVGRLASLGAKDPATLERLARLAGRLGRGEEQLEVEEGLARAMMEREPLESATRLRAIARRALDQLGDPSRAERLLIAAEALAPARAEDRRLLADLQRTSPRTAAQSVETYLELLRGSWPPDPSLLRQLGTTAATLGRSDVSRAALGLASAMGGEAPLAPPPLRPLPPGALAERFESTEPLGELLRHLSPQLERLFAASPARLGLSASSRIGPGCAPHVAELLGTIGIAIGASPLEAHLVPGPVALSLESVPYRVLLVGSHALSSLPAAGLRFLLAQRLILAELGLSLPLKFSHRDLHTLALLVGAFFGGPALLPPEEQSRLAPFLSALHASCPPMLEAKLRPLGQELVAGLPRFDPARFIADGTEQANRLALWVTGDLSGGLAAIAFLEGADRPAWDCRQGRALIEWAFSSEWLRRVEGEAR